MKACASVRTTHEEETNGPERSKKGKKKDGFVPVTVRIFAIRSLNFLYFYGKIEINIAKE